MRKKQITIIETRCRRCGKSLSTASQSFLGLDALKARLGSICEKCITEEERAEMLTAMGGRILEVASR